MWEALISRGQLNEGSLLRQVILEGNNQHETTYTVSRIGEFYFFIRVTTQNEKPILEEHQIVLGYKIKNIRYYGFEIWIE